MKQQNLNRNYSNKALINGVTEYSVDNFHYITTFIQVICLFVGLVVLITSKYGFVFYSAAMIPGVISIFIDRNEHKCASATMCTFNLIGVMPYVVSLLHGDGSTASVQSMISNIRVWVMIYGTALIGHVVYLVVPLLIAKLYILKSSVKSTLLASDRNRICADWRIKSDDPHRSATDEINKSK